MVKLILIGLALAHGAAHVVPLNPPPNSQLVCAQVGPAQEYRPGFPLSHNTERLCQYVSAGESTPLGAR